MTCNSLLSLTIVPTACLFVCLLGSFHHSSPSSYMPSNRVSSSNFKQVVTHHNSRPPIPTYCTFFSPIPTFPTSFKSVSPLFHLFDTQNVYDSVSYYNSFFETSTNIHPSCLQFYDSTPTTSTYQFYRDPLINMDPKCSGCCTTRRLYFVQHFAISTTGSCSSFCFYFDSFFLSIKSLCSLQNVPVTQLHHRFRLIVVDCKTILCMF